MRFHQVFPRGNARWSHISVFCNGDRWEGQKGRFGHYKIIQKIIGTKNENLYL